MDISEEELKNTSKLIKQKSNEDNNNQQHYEKLLKKKVQRLKILPDYDEDNQNNDLQDFLEVEDYYEAMSFVEQLNFDVRQAIVEINNTSQRFTSNLISHNHVSFQSIQSQQSIREEMGLRQPSIEQNIQPAVQIQEQNDGQIRRPVKKKKVRKGQKNKYPTKNFLQCFRAPFLQYLQKRYANDKEFNEFQIIKRIKAKKKKNQANKAGINLRDFQDLFNQKEFEQILFNYFKQKVVTRDLMRSRTKYRLKRIYFKKIHVFEEAFTTGVFEKIN